MLWLLKADVGQHLCRTFPPARLACKWGLSSRTVQADVGNLESPKGGWMSTALRRKVEEGGPGALSHPWCLDGCLSQRRSRLWAAGWAWMEVLRRLVSHCVWSWSGCERPVTRLGCRDVLVSCMFTRQFNQLRNRILRSILSQRQYLTY